jgi:DNA-binding MarR family transcriptional regulator
MPLTFLSPIHKANRQIGLYMEAAMSEFEVSPQEGHILSYLRGYGPCPIAELVRVFGIKQSTLTSLLDRLEGHGLVLRAINPSDRRSFLVSLTSPGVDLAVRIAALVARLESDLSAAVSSGNLKGFQAVMHAIEEVTQITVRPGP